MSILCQIHLVGWILVFQPFCWSNPQDSLVKTPILWWSKPTSWWSNPILWLNFPTFFGQIPTSKVSSPQIPQWLVVSSTVDPGLSSPCRWHRHIPRWPGCPTRAQWWRRGRYGHRGWWWWHQPSSLTGFLFKHQISIKNLMDLPGAPWHAAKWHDWLPIWIRHVSHQHLTLLELAHLIDAGQDVHLSISKNGDIWIYRYSATGRTLFLTPGTQKLPHPNGTQGYPRPSGSYPRDQILLAH